MNQLSLIILLCCLSMIANDLVGSVPTHLNNYKICKSNNCKEAAAYILEGLDTQQNPCDNFYKFVCGKWYMNNTLPKGRNNWSRVSTAERQIKKRLISILEDNEEIINITKPVALMREYYRDCMDLDTLESIGIEPINSLIQKLGDWPLLRDTNDVLSHSWKEIDRNYMEMIGYYSLFQIEIKLDEDERSKNRIEIDTPQFPRIDAFPLEKRWSEYTKNQSLNSPYRKFMMEVIKMFFDYRNMSYSDERLNKDIQDIMDFEYALYRATDNSGDSANEKSTIEQLQFHYDEAIVNESSEDARYDWLKSIRDIFKPTNFTIDLNEHIFISKWKYISRLGRLLSETNSHIIINFVHWNFVATMIPFTNERSRRLFFDVYGEGFINNRLTREEECLIECRLFHALHYEYAKRYFPQGAKENALKMAEIIKDNALKMIDNTWWFDKAIKTTIQDKVKNIHISMGYPDWYSDEQLTNYYKNLQPNATYFGKIINFMKFARLINLLEFHQPATKFPWMIEPITVNARYFYYYNNIIFAMGYILSPNFSQELPWSVKYGFDGFVLAHEIFHALDTHGIHYDKNWKKLNWSKRELKHYQEKISCLTEEFDRFLLVENDPATGDPIWIQSNGTLSAQENFADTAAIRLAYQSLKMQFQLSERETELPGLEQFTSEQLYFISFASRWCRIGTRDWWQNTYGKKYYDEGHSPDQLRVNVALRNFQAFSDAFKCRRNNITPQMACSLFD